MQSLPQTLLKDNYLNVQAMRAVAALLVVVGHTLALGNMELPRILGGGLIHTFAYAGVDIFFVISGFVICAAANKHLQATNKQAGLSVASAFFVRRLFRIYPLYWFLFSLALAWAVMFNPALLPPNKELLAKLYLLMERHNPALSPAWSLVFEMYFYLCTGIILFLSRERFMSLLGAWFALTCVLMLTADTVGLQGSLIVDPLILEFGLGCLIYFLVSRDLVFVPILALLVGLGLFVFGADQTLQYGLLAPSSRVQSFGLGSACILYGLIGLEQQARFSFPRVLVVLGGISYSIYLVHRILIDVALLSLQRFNYVLKDHAVSTCVVMLALVIGMSFLLHYFIERPFIGWGAKLARRLET